MDEEERIHASDAAAAAAAVAAVASASSAATSSSSSTAAAAAFFDLSASSNFAATTFHPLAPTARHPFGVDDRDGHGSSGVDGDDEVVRFGKKDDIPCYLSSNPFLDSTTMTTTATTTSIMATLATTPMTS